MKKYAVGVYFDHDNDTYAFIVEAENEVEAIFKSIEESIAKIDGWDRNEVINELNSDLSIDNVKFTLRNDYGYIVSNPLEL